MRARWLCLALFLALPSCGDDGSGSDGGPPDGAADAEVDAETPDPVTFEAEPDAAELEGCQSEPPADGVARAKHVECSDELVSGSVAMGLTGDILLENSRVRYIIRTGDESASIIGAPSGGIVDAAPHGRDDLVKDILSVIDLSAAQPSDIVVTDAGGDGDAKVRVLFDAAPIGLISEVLGGALRTTPARGAIDYELRGDEDALRITVTFTSNGERPTASGRPGVVALMGGAAELLQPAGEVFEGDTGGSDAGARLMGEAEGSALALRMLPHEGSVSRIDSIHIVSQSDRTSAPVGETTQFEARFAVGTTAAEAWNAAHTDKEDWAALELTGPDGDRVEVQRTDGTPVLRTRLEGGSATVRLPPDDYRLRSGFGSHFVDTPTDVTLEAGGGSASPPAAPSGTLHVEATADGAADAPVRVTVEHMGGGELVRLVAMGPSDFRLPPGDYTVTVSRGMEHDIHAQDVTIADGETANVTAVLDRLVDTTGWVAGDFHLHSEMSTDSTHALRDAVRIIAAEGLEVVAATDHDFLTDYGPQLAETGVDDWVLAVTGVELSHPIIAHVGGYPLQRDPRQAGAGAHAWFDTTPPEWFDALRDLGDESLGGTIVQLNHPRRSGSGFLESIEMDPATGMATVTPEDIGLPAGTDLNDFDFDVIEVWNKSPGGTDEETLQDWLALRAMGRDFAMIGNSDSHDPGNPAGSPRTYVKVPDDTPGAFTWNEVGSSMRAGDMIVTGGIFVTAEPAGAPAGGTLPLDVTVQAAPWVAVDRLRVYAGTEVVVDQAIGATTDVVRFDGTVDVPLGGASFVVARADGTGASRPVIDFEPFGMTNAIDVP